MAISIKLAVAINDLLLYLADAPRGDGTRPSERCASHAARLLADAARQSLRAGLCGEDLDALWPALARAAREARADRTFDEIAPALVGAAAAEVCE